MVVNSRLVTLSSSCLYGNDCRLFPSCSLNYQVHDSCQFYYLNIFDLFFFVLGHLGYL